MKISIEKYSLFYSNNNTFCPDYTGFATNLPITTLGFSIIPCSFVDLHQIKTSKEEPFFVI
jgi:hypothetical protein